MLNQQEICSGCSQLNTKKPRHGIQDYLSVQQADLLFLTESFRWENGPKTISGKELALLLESMEKAGLPPEKTSFAISPAIKCPFVSADTMKTKDANICRKHLEYTILAYKPKFIVCLGNLAFNMLTKKSGIMKKRGSLFEYNGIPVMPIFHPFQVIREPKFAELFVSDLTNVGSILRDEMVKSKVPHTLVRTYEEFNSFTDTFNSHRGEVSRISLDLETTGFDFKRDNIITVGISYRTKDRTKHTWIFVNPEYPFDDTPLNTTFYNYFWGYIFGLLFDEKIQKIMHNAKFDIKFLCQMYENILAHPPSYDSFNNIACSKNLSKFIDENRPNSLNDLVKNCFGVIF